MRPFLSRRGLLTASGVMLFGLDALAQSNDEVVVLLNARNPTQSLPRAGLVKLFLGQTAFWHGVVPVRLLIRPDASKAAAAFYKPILDRTPQAFRKHWDEIQLAGKGVAPKVCDTLEALAKEVSSAPGAIGFGLASEAWQVTGVKSFPVG